MADRDEALHYLLNKLKSEDGWSGASLAWNEEKLSVIADQFSSFDGVVKAKVLLSFLSMTPRTISQVRGTQNVISLSFSFTILHIVICTSTQAEFLKASKICLPKIAVTLSCRNALELSQHVY